MKSPKARSDPRADLIGQLRAAGSILAMVATIGTLVYYWIGSGTWSLEDCFYMAVVTISTVGFAEVLPGMENVRWAREWTLVLIMFGSGSLLYFVSTFTAFVVEGDLRGILQRTRMQGRIDKLSGHIIVCGVGTTGVHILDELVVTQWPFVVVDRDAERLSELFEHIGPDLLFVEGDATEDEVLLLAGIERARGVVAALHDDPDNVYVTITARALNEKLRIIAKAVDPAAVPKFARAGADSVVSTNFIGAMRMVSEMIRPNVVQFLDQMLRDADESRRVEEITVHTGSQIAGIRLREANLRTWTDALVIAIRDASGSHLYNPGPDTLIQDGQVLIVLAKATDLPKLREHAGA